MGVPADAEHGPPRDVDVRLRDVQEVGELIEACGFRIQNASAVLGSHEPVYLSWIPTVRTVPWVVWESFLVLFFYPREPFNRWLFLQVDVFRHFRNVPVTASLMKRIRNEIVTALFVTIYLEVAAVVLCDCSHRNRHRATGRPTI